MRRCGAHSRTTGKPCEAPGNGCGGSMQDAWGANALGHGLRLVGQRLVGWCGMRCCARGPSGTRMARIKYALALGQRRGDRMRAIRKAELARQQREGL